MTAYIQTQIRINQLVKSCVSASGRTKPSELAANLIALVQKDGRIYMEDVQSAFIRLGGVPRTYGNRTRDTQVKWESVVSAVKSCVRQGRWDGKIVITKTKAGDIDFITFEG